MCEQSPNWMPSALFPSGEDRSERALNRRARARPARHSTSSQISLPPMAFLPEQTCYTLSCDELRLFVEFTLNRGEFGRIGSAPDMEISLPLLGLAEKECELSLDEGGVLWLVREGEEQSVQLDPPSYFRAGPYRFLVREKVDVPSSPVPTQRLAEKALVETKSPPRMSRPSKAVMAFVGIGSVAATIWITFQIAQNHQGTSPSSTPTPDPVPKTSAESGTVANPPPEDKLGPRIETAKETPPSTPDTPASAIIPKDADKFDLEKLAKVVGPCVFLVEVIDETGTIMSSGTGFAISADGLVTTNFHVVEHGVKFALR